MKIGKPSLLGLLFIFASTLCMHAQEGNFVQIGDRVGSFYGLKKVWNPEWFQGVRKKKNYFEGWYFKVVSEDGKHRFAFIPGVSLGKDRHCFIQVINGINGSTQYYRFPIDSFYFSPNGFSVRIGSNFFSEDSICVRLNNEDNAIYANIKNSNLTKYPVKALSPGIMGWYRFVPFMECFHGVVSINHNISGKLIIDSDTVTITNGKGYIEKDWGKSMPSAWIWSQSNNFLNNSNTSFMLSVANIPWMGNSFTGFLGYLKVNDKLYRFATYTGAKLKNFQIDQDSVRLTIKERKFSIQFMGKKGAHGNLLAPVQGDMERNIHESIDAEIIIKLFNRKGELIYEDSAKIAGLELVGDAHKLF